jgi:hypothetical protein
VAFNPDRGKPTHMFLCTWDDTAREHGEVRDRGMIIIIIIIQLCAGKHLVPHSEFEVKVIVGRWESGRCGAQDLASWFVTSDRWQVHYYKLSFHTLDGTMEIRQALQPGHSFDVYPLVLRRQRVLKFKVRG